MKLTNNDIESKLLNEVNDITPNILSKLKDERVIRAENKQRVFNFKIMKLASVFVLLLLLTITGVVTYNYEYETVTIDVNPSVELKVNVFGIVTKVNYNNEDAYNTFNDAKLKNKNIDDAIINCYEKLYDNGYLSLDNNMIIISGYVENKEYDSNKLEKFNQIIEEENKKRNVICEVVKNVVTEEQKQKAKENDISVGKLKLIDMILMESEESNFDELKDLSMKDLKDKFNDFKNKVESSIDEFEKLFDELKEEYAYLDEIKNEILELTNSLLTSTEDEFLDILNILKEKQQQFNEGTIEYEQKIKDLMEKHGIKNEERTPSDKNNSKSR